MRIVRTIRELREGIAAARAESATIGFVPTMGALHEGHLSLVRAARAENDLVVVSIFVNPTQFDEAADLETYPRREAADADLAEAAGADLIFAPDAAELYPDGFATTVGVTGLIAESLEGSSRGRGHFDGVATVVAKLFIAVAPDRAYFGEKDAQQVMVVRRMAADLGLPVDVIACPTSRDADGLARSSRNARLSAEERRRALAIPRALALARDMVEAGERNVARLQRRLSDVLEESQLDIEYVAVVDPATFEAKDRIDAASRCLIAARVGATRLIDNQLITVGG